jgi:hypothetical protein
MCRGETAIVQGCEHASLFSVEQAAHCVEIPSNLIHKLGGRGSVDEVGGLTNWMETLGLTVHLDAARRWCEDRGATDLTDVVHRCEDFVQSLPLKPLEIRRVRKYCSERNPNEATEALFVLPKRARRSKVRFDNFVVVYSEESDLEGEAVRIATSKDTRRSYAQLHAARLVPHGSFFGQEARAAPLEPTVYDQDEPAVLLAMIASGEYKITGPRGLAASFARAAAGYQASTAAAEESRRKYWEQYVTELKPLLSKGGLRGVQNEDQRNLVSASRP